MGTKEEQEYTVMSSVNDDSTMHSGPPARPPIRLADRPHTCTQEVKADQDVRLTRPNHNHDGGTMKWVRLSHATPMSSLLGRDTFALTFHQLLIVSCLLRCLGPSPRQTPVSTYLTAAVPREASRAAARLVGIISAFHIMKVSAGD